MKKNSKFNMRLIIVTLLLVVVLTVVLISITSSSLAVLLDNGSRIEENSDLTYYIDVLYDGKDSQAVSSSDTVTAKIKSDYIYVEDRLPEGLTFKKFVTSNNGSIGAVKRSDNKTSCPGYVVGGTEGLVYNQDTNTVSFKVKGLQAGCKLTVGVITTTPTLNNKERIDFYNTAFARENNFSAQSNTVHVFMGRENANAYKVIYEYTGYVPQNSNVLPPVNSYTSGSIVAVANNPNISGYKFNGWSSQDVEIKDRKFIMPDKEVKLTGTFTKKENYYVNYQIEGDAPESYKVPSQQEYFEGDDVFVDSLKKGDVIDGYRFLGWETENIEVVFSGGDYSFVMPNNNVEFVGKFEKENYEVSYQFQGSTIPDNFEQLLPKKKKYYPGDKVEVAPEPVAEGYEFLGWYKTDFIMPNKDVVISGEWSKKAGVFQPTIMQEIVNPKNKYIKGDIVQFKITVTNTSSYAINDVMLKGKYDFISGDNYILMNTNYVKIPVINAFGSVSVYAQYKVNDSLYKQLQNDVKLVGAIANGDYFLDVSKEYKSSVPFITGSISLDVHKIDKNNQTLTGAEFALYNDSNLTDVVATGLSFSDLNVDSIYYLKELKAPKNYVLSDTIYEVVVNPSGKVSVNGQELEIKDSKYVIDIVNKKQNFINSPDTIDSIITYIILFIISILLIIFVIYKLRKNNHKGNKKKREEKTMDELPELLDI